MFPHSLGTTLLCLPLDFELSGVVSFAVNAGGALYQKSIGTVQQVLISHLGNEVASQETKRNNYKHGSAWCIPSIISLALGCHRWFKHFPGGASDNSSPALDLSVLYEQAHDMLRLMKVKATLLHRTGFGCLVLYGILVIWVYFLSPNVEVRPLAPGKLGNKKEKGRFIDWR